MLNCFAAMRHIRIHRTQIQFRALLKYGATHDLINMGKAISLQSPPQINRRSTPPWSEFRHFSPRKHILERACIYVGS